MNRRTSIREWATRRLPDYDVVSATEPEPVLDEYNVLAVTRDPSAARSVIVSWESIEDADAAVGLLSLERAGRSARANRPTVGADREDVVPELAGNVLRGIVPGALAGAVILASVLFIITDAAVWAVAGAIAGGAFGGVAGGVGAFAARTGLSPAYQESFVASADSDVLIASIHTPSGRRAAEAVAAVAEIDRVQVLRVAPSGAASPAVTIT